MVTVLDFAILSAHVYNPSPTNFYGLTILKYKNTSIAPQNAWVRVTDVDPHVQPENHFYAQLYIKFIHGKATDAVVSVRGTNFQDIQNIKTDVYSWYSDVLGDGASVHYPRYYPLVVSFFKKARDYIHQHFPQLKKIHLTGHSLGGALAQLVVLAAGFPYRSVVFNSPGVGNMKGVNPDLASYILNINSRYGIINKIGVILGHVDLVDVSQHEAEAKALFDTFDGKNYDESVREYKQDHYIDNIKGFAQRMQSLLHSKNTFTTFSDVKQALAKCENDYNTEEFRKLQQQVFIPPKANQAMMTAVAEHRMVCEAGVILGKANEVIVAQHSIQNILQALSGQKCLQLAHTTV